MLVVEWVTAAHQALLPAAQIQYASSTLQLQKHGCSLPMLTRCCPQEDVQLTLQATTDAMGAELEQLQRVCSHKLAAAAV